MPSTKANWKGVRHRGRTPLPFRVPRYCSHGAVRDAEAPRRRLSPCLEWLPPKAPRPSEAATAANQKRLTEANEGNEISAFGPNSGFVLFVTFCETPGPIAIQHVLKRSIKVGIERIRAIRIFRQVAPVLVHPESGELHSFVRN
jgi:hypothetical protein